MSDMPKEIWAGDSQGYNMWRESDGVVVLDSETKYIRADLVPQWQPIETAPRDGTRILLFSQKYGPSTGHWSEQKELQEGYFPVEGHWKMHSVLNKEEKPTHWMPLLEPPKED